MPVKPVKPVKPLNPHARLRCARRPVVPLTLVAACTLWGCAPTLDWREVRPPASQLLLLFPCKPSAQQRQVQLAGQPVQLTLHACSAGGQTWGLAVADVADPARVAPALAALSAAAAVNIGVAPPAAAPSTAPAAAPAAAPFAVRGATPNSGSQRFLLQGKLPDGKPVTLHTAVFTHGTQVFQASVFGEPSVADTADTFFDALRVQP